MSVNLYLSIATLFFMVLVISSFIMSLMYAWEYVSLYAKGNEDDFLIKSKNKLLLLHANWFKIDDGADAIFINLILILASMVASFIWPLLVPFIIYLIMLGIAYPIRKKHLESKKLVRILQED